MKINFAKTIRFCERNKDQNYRAIYSYIQKAIKYVKKLYAAKRLEISNDIILYDLIKNENSRLERVEGN